MNHKPSHKVTNFIKTSLLTALLLLIEKCKFACGTGQYLSGAHCHSCPPNCKTCTGGAAHQCTSCKPPSTRGHPTRGSFPCVNCSPRCTLCSGDGESKCWGCTDPNQRVFAAGLIKPGPCRPLSDCEFGFFNSRTHCLKCNIACNGCTRGTDMDCQECAHNEGFKYYRWTSSNRCAVSCNPGSYPDDETKSCIKCGNGCELCSFIEGQCYKCKKGFILEGRGMKNCVKKCKRKKFMKEEVTMTYKLNQIDEPKQTMLDTCLDCHETCDGATDTDCTSCGLTPDKNPVYLTDEGRCIIRCPPKFYPKLRTYKCLPCYPGCETCVDGRPTSCIICETGLIKRLDGSCGKRCLRGKFALSAAKPCGVCHSSCLSCIDAFPTSCLRCRPGVFLRVNGSCGKGCSQGSFKNTILFKRPKVLNCLPCHESCLTCDGPGDQRCIKCKKLVLKKPESEEVEEKSRYLDDGFCRPDCNKDGIYTHNSTHCGHCAERCARCSSPLPGDCSRCLPGTLRNEETNHCTVRCYEGFYDDGKGLCRRCHPRCLTCIRSGASECMKCKLNTKLDGQRVPSTFSPVEGYYFTGNVLQKCHSSCKACKAGGPLSCESCAYNFLLRLDNSCVENCPPREYILVGSGGIRRCMPCDESCFSCDGDGDKRCTSCSQPGNVVIKELSFQKSGYCVQCSTKYKKYPDDCYMVKEPKLFDYHKGKAVDLYSAISFKIFFPDAEGIIERMAQEVDLDKDFGIEISQLEAGTDYEHKFEWFNKEAYITLNFTSETKQKLKLTLTPKKRSSFSHAPHQLLPLKTQ